MFKMFLTILAMSDTGAVSTSVAITDYPNRETCERSIVDLMPSKVERELGGHRLVVSTNASCRPSYVPPQVGVLGR